MVGGRRRDGDRPFVKSEARPANARSRRLRARAVLPLLATLAGIALAARLGVWQLDRADQKIALQTSLEARSREPALDGPSLARSPLAAEAQHHRRVSLRGRWLAERTVFLDNRQMNGKVGFFVVTPLALTPGSGVVLVQRGWAARHFTSRTELPALTTPEGIVAVDGIVAPAPSRLFEFADAASGPIRQNLDIASFARDAGLDGRRPAAPLAGAGRRRAEALRLCLPVVRPRGRHRLPLCLASIHPPRQALTRRCSSTSAFTRCRRRRMLRCAAPSAGGGS